MADLLNGKKIGELEPATSIDNGDEIPGIKPSDPAKTYRFSWAVIKVAINAMITAAVAGITKGDKGDTGAKGDQGIQGEKGVKGDKGDKGDPGIKGDQGVKGDPGIQGTKGDKGDKGDPGTQGTQGIKGDKGDKGDQGDAGLNGVPGADGVGVPVGGAIGQVLAKKSNTDHDTEWIDKNTMPSQKSGYNISFEKPYIYNGYDVTDSQNTAITFDFTNAKLGQVQKMYHNGIYNIELPGEAVRIGSAPYVAGQLNIVYLEFVDTDRVEYWIVQEG